MKFISKFFVTYRTVKLVFLIVLLIALFHFYFEYIYVDESDIVDEIHKNNLKAVQLLTGRFSSNDWKSSHVSLGEYPFLNCKEKRCYAFKPYYFRQKPIEESDAIIVHVPNLFFMPSKSNYKRNPKQLWLFLTMESQRRSFCSSHYTVSEMDDWFNLTATFKLSSTLLNDYKPFRSFKNLKTDPRFLKHFIMIIKEQPLNGYFEKQLDLKPKEKPPVLWFVSHCETPSKRELFVKELNQHIDIDIFGECNSHFKHSKTDPCHKVPKLQEEECNIKLYNQYKFYLAFENSLCDEYVTEKYWKLYFFERFFKVDIIPVVRGPKPDHYEKISIKKSYINADDFKTAKSLADYLLYLNENQTAYLEYFEWKLDYYKFYRELSLNNLTQQIEANFAEPSNDPFCQVCEKLHDKTYMNSKNDLIKISKYFNPTNDCWDEPESPLLDRFIRFFGYCI